MNRYNKMSKTELIAALLALNEQKASNRSKDPTLDPTDVDKDELQRVLHELQVHQVELEMQNRELRENQQALEVSRNHYVELYDFAPFGYLTLDHSGCLLNINLTGAAMFGEERARLIGTPLIAYITKEDAPLFLKHLKKCWEGGIKISTDLSLVPKRNRSVSVHMSSIVVQDESDQAIVYRTTITDITERKQAGEALQKMHDTLEIQVAERTEALNQANGALLKENEIRREAEERLRSLLEAAPDAILTTDRYGQIRYANEQADIMFAYEKGALIGQSIKTLLPERFRTAHASHHQSYVEAPETRPMGEGLNLVALRKDGREIPVEISLSPLKTGQGLVVTCIIRDVSYRRRIEESLRTQALQLEEKILELEDFAHVVSHDLKEPLRGISAFSNLLKKEYGSKLDEEGLEYTQLINASAERMDSLIEALLTLASISRKEHTLIRVDLNQVLTDVQEALSFSIHEKQAEIRCPSPLPTLRCDPTQIAMVFKDLLSNAIKFNTATPPKIEISVKEEDHAYLFSVKDNGIGIDPRYAERIFRLFERLHPDEKFKGTGAGLAICKKVINQYGGKIWLESQPGEGACFCFTLPKNAN